MVTIGHGTRHIGPIPRLYPKMRAVYSNVGPDPGIRAMMLSHYQFGRKYTTAMDPQDSAAGAKRSRNVPHTTQEIRMYWRMCANIDESFYEILIPWVRRDAQRENCFTVSHCRPGVLANLETRSASKRSYYLACFPDERKDMLGKPMFLNDEYKRLQERVII